MYSIVHYQLSLLATKDAPRQLETELLAELEKEKKIKSS